ncbi:glutathione-disulfide reductase [Pelomicrobium sp. G1]|uniref:glutathione-disulfide reductase n=1 Tax=unclassified Pelomicrobium TaxID=2815318 RepID=UPI003F769799
MTRFDYDLFVIGAGSGGVRAARVAAGYGARVAIAEERFLGGTCVNVGCIPKKLFSYAAHFREDFEDAEGFGWKAGRLRFDWTQLRQNKDREIARLNGVYERLLEASGVTLLRGRARVLGPHRVRVGERNYTAGHLLVATGARAVVPPIPGAELGITSDAAFFLEALPKRALVVGGGYIAVEFASIFNGLGVETTLAYRGPHLLRGFDDEVRQFLAGEMEKKGVRILFNTRVLALRAGAGGRREVCFGDGREEAFDLVMFATGRAPSSRGFGLEETGVKLAENGAIVVDEAFRSSVPSIYALGDVIDRLKLTPVAIHEAMAFAQTRFGASPKPMDYENVPTAVFSHPNVGAVGLTEARARERYSRVDVYTTAFRPLKLSLTPREERTFMKLVVDGATDRVLGVHMVGPEAGEVVQGFAVALQVGATKAQFDATVGIHPTLAEEFVTMRERKPEPGAVGLA